jgi:class 3 adenylate cyclase/tetratricopeptide (TPR) repeat protein
MTCAECGHQNVSRAKFCSECGTPLAQRCAQCGGDLPASAKFCPECGQAVTPVRAAPAAPVPERFSSPEQYTPQRLAEKILGSRTAMEGERKHVTILFADLRGSMELLASRDPEDARQMLDRVLERMMEAVHWYEGTVNQVMGDGIMALFGAPVALEDHAIRACYAAVRMQDSLRRWGEGIGDEAAATRIRVGINSGEVVVRSIGSDLRMDYSAVGESTHLAARLEQIADPGTVLISPATLALVDGYVQVESRGPTPVKGMPEPIELFRLTGVHLVRSRLQARTGRAFTKFIGRSPEVATLEAALTQARQGHGQVVAVVAEAGVGKSRLCAELIRSPSAQTCLTLETGCISYRRATPWLPIVELLRTYFQIESGEASDKTVDKVVGRVLSLDETLAPFTAAFLWLLDAPVDDPEWLRLDPQQRRLRALEGVKRLLLYESRVQPLIVIMEDLHWIDSETQALLDGLIAALPKARLLLLINYRPEYRHGWINKSWYHQIRIGALAPATAEEFLRALLGENPALELLKRLIIERTGGVPFFLEECVWSLRKSGALVGERGNYQLTQPVNEVRVPATVQDMLAARIDGLPEDEKRLLQATAVAGTAVDFSLLCQIADVPDEELRRLLAHLQEADFIYESRLFPDLEYSFRHALTHEVAYQGLVRGRRRMLHARIVEAIERLHANRIDEHVDRLGHHAFRGELWEKAVEYLRRAGLRAHGRFANGEAVALFEQALAALVHLPASTTRSELGVDLRLDLRASLYQLGEWEKIFTVLGEAQELAVALGDDGRGGWISVQIGDALRQSGRILEALPPMERARAAAERCGDEGLRLAVYQYLSVCRYAAGDFHGALELMEAISQAESGSSTVVAFGRTNAGSRAGFFAVALNWLARCLGECGDFERGALHGEHAVTLAESVDDPYSLALACIGLGYLHLLKGDTTQAIPLLERARAATHERNTPVVELQAVRNLALAYCLAGQLDAGVPMLEEALREVEARRFTVQQVTVILLLAEAYLLAGRIDDALALATRGMALARERGQRGEQAVALRLLGEAALTRSPIDGGAAEKSFREAAALAEACGMQPQAVRCELGLGRLFAVTGDIARAHEALASATIRLAELGMERWAKQAIETVGTIGRLIVVAGDRPQLFALLARIATTDSAPSIVLDRRHGVGAPAGVERRSRRSVDVALGGRGLAIIADIPEPADD